MLGRIGRRARASLSQFSRHRKKHPISPANRHNSHAIEKGFDKLVGGPDEHALARAGQSPLPNVALKARVTSTQCRSAEGRIFPLDH
jgi:hypothetical protein